MGAVASSLNVVDVDAGEGPGSRSIAEFRLRVEGSAGAALESCLLLGTEKLLINVCGISH